MCFADPDPAFVAMRIQISIRVRIQVKNKQVPGRYRRYTVYGYWLQGAYFPNRRYLTNGAYRRYRTYF